MELPSKGLWFTKNPYAHTGNLTEIYIQPQEGSKASLANEGDRQGRLSDRLAIAGRRHALHGLYWACHRYATDGDGSMPSSIEELASKPTGKKSKYLRKLEAVEGVHFMGRGKLYEEGGNQRQRVHPPRMIAFDTKPAIDDGKHWTIDSHGQSTRVKIDEALLEEHQVTVTASQKPYAERKLTLPPTLPHSIYARLLDNEITSSQIILKDHLGKNELTITWDTGELQQSNEEDMIKPWAQLRAATLRTHAPAASPLMTHWMGLWQRQYGIDLRAIGMPETNVNNRGETATAMNVLGGRAAIRETLQMRELSLASDNASTERTVPIEQVKGVEVKSHPFEAMLAEAPMATSANLPLATWVPHDRFMAYFPKPAGLLSMLEGGASFLHESGSGIMGRKAAYNLKERYLKRLGLSETLMKQFLNTGAITEMAVVLPDLFFIDGTELTVIARTKSPLLTKAALTMLGVPSGDGSHIKRTPSGSPVVWTQKGDILLISTSKQETEAVLAAAESDASLGKSAEFRYMLTQVPVTSNTRAYTYFSDPFIRKLVSPRTKIGQLRRLHARAELEEASAARLAARFDGHQALPTIELISRDYLRQPLNADGLGISVDDVSTSTNYGRISHLASLQANSISFISTQEEQAYKTYLDRYNRYWRRYFDPIAIRYDQRENREHQLDTFILPLIDNSLYAGLKQFLASREEALPLRIPQLSPEPVAMFSMNLNEEAWLEMIEDFSRSFTSMLGLDGSILDQLGPDIHIAIMDADPVITLGSGELQSLLGRFGGRVDSDMTMIPIVVSMLTRPSSVLFGLQDPEAVSSKLDRMAIPSGHRAFGFGEANLYRVTGEEKWIFSISLEGLITLRFGFEVKDRYLVVSNLPFTEDIEVSTGDDAPNQAAYLSLSPQACLKQLPALFASATEKARASALSGASCLSPILVANQAITVAEAQQQHSKWFGFTPQHPVGGHWTRSDGSLVSSLYGAPWNQQQPGYDPTNTKVGPMQSIATLDLSMQFEHDGLRSTVRWKLK